MVVTVIKKSICVSGPFYNPQIPHTVGINDNTIFMQEEIYYDVINTEKINNRTYPIVLSNTKEDCVFMGSFTLHPSSLISKQTYVVYNESLTQSVIFMLINKDKLMRSIILKKVFLWK